MKKGMILGRQLGVVSIAIALLAVSACATGQRTGDSTRVNVGIVENKQRVNLQSDAGRNALIGGALGWALARNQSSGTQAAAAMGGAMVGAGATSAAEGVNQGIQYTVRTSNGSAIRVITDQSEILVGDCVVVEETGNHANIRRQSPALCKPASPQVVAEVQDELQEEASECDAAKERLFEAKTPDEVEVARQVMEILCNG
ncbi:MAG: hypothetical protein AAGF57_06125 [Pseudomonadota bacterium]